MLGTYNSLNIYDFGKKAASIENPDNIRRVVPDKIIDNMESILKTGNCDHVITTDPNTTVYYSIKFISGILEIQEDNTMDWKMLKSE